jgi:Holliday junction resolvasome RuvABC ATP-dependent DNA helicase subunit
MDKGVFKRIMDNIAFAMDLNDRIPEHIRQEIIREESSGRARNKSIEEFNAAVSRKLPQQQPPSEDVLFSEIQGYSDLKHLLTKMVMSDQSVHAVLVGPPSSGKTMFLMSIQQKMKDAFFIDGTNASGPGIVDKLFSLPDTEVIIVDEIEKMSTKDQNMLLNLLETGKLISTKVRKTAEMEFKEIKLFATSNDIDAISKPLRSRLIELHLPEYSEQEFQDIVIKLVCEKYRLDGETAKEISRVVWHEIGTKDVRDAIQLSKLVDNVNDVMIMARTIMKYGRKKHD